MSGKRYPEEFNVSSVAIRLGIVTHSLYVWIKTFG